jgi:aspartate carbamoyltransferase regulatory subunit
LGYLDPSITVSIIKDGKTVEKKKLTLPKTISDIEVCKNTRCITSSEVGLQHIFYLANEERHIYRCKYCDSRVEKSLL